MRRWPSPAGRRSPPVTARRPRRAAGSPARPANSRTRPCRPARTRRRPTRSSGRPSSRPPSGLRRRRRRRPRPPRLSRRNLAAIGRDLETLDHEELLVRRGRRSGLFTIVAVHSTARGPSLGGCRMWSYADSRDAVADALRLSRAMTFKAAVADLPQGGGKGVIMRPLGDPPPQGEQRRAALLDFGDTIDILDGRYRTAEDVGTSDPDMTVIAERTPHVTGLA